MPQVTIPVQSLLTSWGTVGQQEGMAQGTVYKMRGGVMDCSGPLTEELSTLTSMALPFSLYAIVNQTQSADFVG